MNQNQDLAERYIAPRLKLWIKWLMPAYTEAEMIFDELKRIKDSQQVIQLIRQSSHPGSLNAD